MRFWLSITCFLALSFPVFAQQNTAYKDPTVALENFEFEAIDYTALDSVYRDCIKALEHSLYHRFDKAEALLKKVALQTASPVHAPARSHLLSELYFRQGKYSEYVSFADQIKEKPELYELATALVRYPAMQLSFSTDSLMIPVTIRKHSYVIATVFLNGKPARLVLDSGASFSIISKKLNDELKPKPLADLNLRNALGITFNAPIGLLDSLTFGYETFL